MRVEFSSIAFFLLLNSLFSGTREVLETNTETLMWLRLMHEASVMFGGEWLFPMLSLSCGERVGVKVMLCGLLVKRSVAEYLMRCHAMLSASAFCGVLLLLLASLFSCRLFHSPVFIRATYAGSSNMLACSFLKAVPAGLGDLPYQHLKL